MNAFRRNESGQTLVEFALIASLLFLVLFGIIEFGRIFHAYLVVTSAAREGARKAAVTGTAADIEAAIVAAVASLSDNVVARTRTEVLSATAPSAGQVWYAIYYPQNGGVRRFGDPVEIYIKGRVDLVVPIISNIVGTPYLPRAYAVMRVET
jgi:Flp pilus assembly protein TadG